MPQKAQKPHKISTLHSSHMRNRFRHVVAGGMPGFVLMLSAWLAEDETQDALLSSDTPSRCGGRR
jgi:hypothetical protein